MAKSKVTVRWRVNTPQLLREVLCNNETKMLSKPLQIFSNILAEVSDRAIELNDPKLNALMCRLALYEESDPYNSGYDGKLIDKVIKEGYNGK